MISSLNNLKDLVENLDRKKLIIKLIPYAVIAYLGNKLYYCFLIEN